MGGQFIGTKLKYNIHSNVLLNSDEDFTVSQFYKFFHKNNALNIGTHSPVEESLALI